MPTRDDAPGLIADLFDDGGRSILAEGGNLASWNDALADMPDALFEVPTKTPGLTWLTLARDLWNRADQLQLATAVTKGLLQWHIDQKGHEHPDAIVELAALGVLTQKAGQVDQGAEMLRQSYNALRSVAGGRDLRLAVVATNLGLHHARLGELNEARHCLEVALKIRQSEAPATVAGVAGQLAEVLLRLDATEEGLEALRTAWLCELDHLGENHPQTLRRMHQLAQVLNRVKGFREAVPLWRTLDKAVQSSGHLERIADVSFHLAYALIHSHKLEEGIRRMAQALGYTRQATGPDGEPHPELANRLTTYAELAVRNQQPEEALGLLREAVEVERRRSGDAHPATARRHVTLGMLLARIGELDEAMGTLASAAQLLASTEGPRDPSTITAVEASLGLLARKAEVHLANRDKATAGALLTHGLQLGGPSLGFDHPAILTLRKIALEHRIHL